MKVPDRFRLAALSAVFVLLKGNLVLSHQALDKIFENSGSLPNAHVAQFADDGKSARIDIAGRQYSVFVVPAPIPRKIFCKLLSLNESIKFWLFLPNYPKQLVVRKILKPEW